MPHLTFQDRQRIAAALVAATRGRYAADDIQHIRTTPDGFAVVETRRGTCQLTVEAFRAAIARAAETGAAIPRSSAVDVAQRKAAVAAATSPAAVVAVHPNQHGVLINGRRVLNPATIARVDTMD